MLMIPSMWLSFCRSATLQTSFIFKPSAAEVLTLFLKEILKDPQKTSSKRSRHGNGLDIAILKLSVDIRLSTEPLSQHFSIDQANVTYTAQALQHWRELSASPFLLPWPGYCPILSLFLPHSGYAKKTLLAWEMSLSLPQGGLLLD